MKKIITLIITLTLLMASCALADSMITVSAGEERLPASAAATVVLTVDYDANEFFSIYDADMYLDGQYIATLAQGDVHTVRIENVSAGTPHEISFYNCTDYSKADGTHKILFTPEGDTAIDCNIHLFRTGVYVSRKTITGLAGGKAVPGGMGTLSCEIIYESNVAAAKYTVQMRVDGQVVAEFGNGTFNTVRVPLSNGKHTVSFNKKGASGVSSSVTIITSGDSRFSCRLKTHLKSIDVKNISTTAVLQ